MGKMPKIPSQAAPQKLTERTDAPFVISFRRRLPKGYQFTDLQRRDLEKFQGFLDKVSQCTVSQVDGLYKHPTDSKDTFDGRQVVHYECSEYFRLHGIYENARFEVIRLDPNHKRHKD